MVMLFKLELYSVMFMFLLVTEIRSRHLFQTLEIEVYIASLFMFFDDE